jgi:hypothetical protein
MAKPQMLPPMLNNIPIYSLDYQKLHKIVQKDAGSFQLSELKNGHVRS